MFFKKRTERGRIELERKRERERLETDEDRKKERNAGHRQKD